MSKRKSSGFAPPDKVRHVMKKRRPSQDAFGHGRLPQPPASPLPTPRPSSRRISQQPSDAQLSNQYDELPRELGGLGGRRTIGTLRPGGTMPFPGQYQVLPMRTSRQPYRHPSNQYDALPREMQSQARQNYDIVPRRMDTLSLGGTFRSME